MMQADYSTTPQKRARLTCTHKPLMSDLSGHAPIALQCHVLTRSRRSASTVRAFMSNVRQLGGNNDNASGQH